MSESTNRIVTACDIVAWGWDGAQRVDQLETLRWETIEGLADRHRADPQSWGAVFMEHPQTWRILCDRSKHIQGYWHFLSLHPDTYQHVKPGRLVSTEIQLEMIRPLLPGEHDIYLVTCWIRPSFRSVGPAIDLMTSFWALLLELAEDGVFLREICTNAFTQQGSLLARTAGLEYVKDHDVSGQIFAASMRDMLQKPRASQSVSTIIERLRTLY